MPKNSAVNLDITNNADGFDITGGTTRRKITATGADITITGSGTNVYTFPTATDTLVGRTSTDTLTNKTLTAPVISAHSATAGTATKITSGTVMTTAEAGALEYDGKAFYMTPNTSNRAVNAVAHIISQTADYTGTNANTVQKVFNTSTNGAITLPASTSYLMEGIYHIHTTGTTSHSLGISFGGTATLTSIGYHASATNAATEALGAPQTIWISVATNTTVTSAVATASHHTIVIKGIVRVNASGTFIPQYTWSAAPGVAGVTLANSYLLLIPIGSNTAGSIGNWS
jgi:hypothetical protein